MASTVFGGKVPLIISDEKEVDDFMGYSLKKPDDVYLESVGEDYFPQWNFNWVDDSVCIRRKNKLIKYTEHWCLEIHAIDEEGKEVWIKGTEAPYADCWDGTYLGDEPRQCIYYTVEEFDLETKTVKTYKVELSEERPMKDWEVKQYGGHKEEPKAEEIFDDDLNLKPGEAVDNLNPEDIDLPF